MKLSEEGSITKIIIKLLILSFLLLPQSSIADDDTNLYYLSDGEIKYNHIQESNMTSIQVNSSIHPFEPILDIDSYSMVLETVQTITMNTEEGIISFDMLFENNFKKSKIIDNGVDYDAANHTMYWYANNEMQHENTTLDFRLHRTVNVTSGLVYTANGTYGSSSYGYVPSSFPNFDKFNMQGKGYILSTEKVHGGSGRNNPTEVFLPVNYFKTDLEIGTVLLGNSRKIVRESNIGGLETWVIIGKDAVEGELSGSVGHIYRAELEIEKKTGLIMRVEVWEEYFPPHFYREVYHMKKILVEGFDRVQLVQTEETPFPFYYILLSFIPVFLLKRKR